MNDAIINEKLRDVRKEKRFTQKQLADKVGVSEYSVRRWEKYETWPGVYERGKLCRVLGKTEEELGFSDSDKERYDEMQKAKKDQVALNYEQEEMVTEEPAVQQLTFEETREKFEMNNGESQEAQAPVSSQPTAEAAPPEAASQQQRLTRNGTPFVGHEEDIKQVCAWLKDSATRILMLHGSYGVGKSELAWQVGQEVADSFVVKFVSLREANDEDSACLTIVKAFGYEGDEIGDDLKELLQTVWQKPTLLVLDPFEHLIEMYPDLWSMLHLFPQVKILLVSRACSYVSHGDDSGRQLIPPECLYEVLPLSCPDRYDLVDLKADLARLPEKLLDYNAVALFVERARAFKRNFVITPENSVYIADICCKLGGNPFDLTLAAESLRSRSLKELRRDIWYQALLSAKGVYAGAEKPITLCESLRWSFDRLTDAEKQLFHELSVFYHDFSLAAAQAVSLLSDEEVLAGIISLAEQGLLQIGEEVEDETRYRMFFSSTVYLRELVNEPGEAARRENAHRDYYLNLLKRLAMEGDLAAYKKGWLRAEYNIYSALSWSRNHSERKAFGELLSYGFLYPRQLNLIPPSEVADFEAMLNQEGGPVVSWQIALEKEEVRGRTLPVLQAAVSWQPLSPSLESREPGQIPTHRLIIAEPKIERHVYDVMPAYARPDYNGPVIGSTLREKPAHLRRGGPILLNEDNEAAQAASREW